jgi:apolipoprotein N-acyltransferase
LLSFVDALSVHVHLGEERLLVLLFLVLEFFAFLPTRAKPSSLSLSRMDSPTTESFFPQFALPEIPKGIASILVIQTSPVQDPQKATNFVREEIAKFRKKARQPPDFVILPENWIAGLLPRVNPFVEQMQMLAKESCSYLC